MEEALEKKQKARQKQGVFLLMLLVFVLDQGSKLLAEHLLKEVGSVPVIDKLFSFTLAYNTGAAWSMLEGQRLLLIALPLVMLFILWKDRAFLMESRLTRFSTALFTGGILGNLLDRIVRGEVVDFLHVHWKEVWNFPIFNIADSCICVGVFLFLLYSLPCFHEKPSSSSQDC